ncbi:plasmodesmata-located protein 6-like [Punica granatum]|uniref:Plasmodesmata-located protein 6-like n=1 Tax=Punica granatum TaxID=22663 RepID=A0A6P8CN04_PUNGR|nr:plasmodesmata-located protein 6-like [Punica granatum]
MTLSVPSLSLLFPLITVLVCALLSPSTSDTNSLVYVGCSQFKYSVGSSYESSINNLLTSLVNSANSAPYNNFTMTGSTAEDTVSGFYQCRGDLSPSSCFSCVSKAVSQLGTFCVKSTGGAVQLQGCLMKYDNTTFLGVEDKSVLFKRCGPMVGYATDLMTRHDAVLGYIGTDDGTYKPYRFSASGSVQAEAQCVQDLNQGECQDCMTEAIRQLKTECGGAKWGNMFLAKCYARFWDGGDPSGGRNGSDKEEETQKTVIILVVLIVAAAVVTVLLSLFQALTCQKAKGGK